MKKLILAVLSIFMFSTVAMALDWHAANQITVAWDAVAKIELADAITYKVYHKKVGGDPVFDQETATLTATITLADEGKYYFGVSTKRVTDAEELESDINWSDVNGESTPNPFGAKFYIVPGAPKNLHLP